MLRHASVRGMMTLRVYHCIDAVTAMGGGGGGGGGYWIELPGGGGGAADALSQMTPSASRALHGLSSAYM